MTSATKPNNIARHNTKRVHFWGLRNSATKPILDPPPNKHRTQVSEFEAQGPRAAEAEFCPDPLLRFRV